MSSMMLMPSFPDVLKHLRKQKHLSQDELGAAAGLNGQTISNIETGRIETPRGDSYRRIAKALDLTTEQLDRLWQDNRLEIIAHSDVPPAAFNLGIAAGGWVELGGQGTGLERSAQRGIVIVKIAGDSMEPRWHNGEAVMFTRFNQGEDQPAVNVDYLFIRNDNHGTFKRLVAIDGEQYVLRALNKKYTKPLRISAQEVVLMAEARFKVSEPEDI